MTTDPILPAVSVAVTNEARFARCSVYVPPEGCPDRPHCPVHGKAPCAGYYAEAPEGDRYCAQPAEHWVMSPTHANRAGFIWSDREAEESYARVLAGEPAAPRVVDVDSLATDEDIYLITARAHSEKDLEIIGVSTTPALLDAAVRRRAADPRHRAVVDAARAGVLAEMQAARDIYTGCDEDDLSLEAYGVLQRMASALGCERRG